jgi:hypothetical protein
MQGTANESGGYAMNSAQFLKDKALEYVDELAQIGPGAFNPGAVNVVMMLFTHGQLELLELCKEKRITGVKLFDFWHESQTFEAFKAKVSQL